MTKTSNNKISKTFCIMSGKCWVVSAFPVRVISRQSCCLSPTLPHRQGVRPALRQKRCQWRFGKSLLAANLVCTGFAKIRTLMSLRTCTVYRGIGVTCFNLLVEKGEALIRKQLPFILDRLTSMSVLSCLESLACTMASSISYKLHLLPK